MVVEMKGDDELVPCDCKRSCIIVENRSSEAVKKNLTLLVKWAKISVDGGRLSFLIM